METPVKTFERPLPSREELSPDSEGPTELKQLNLAEFISQPVLVVGSNGYGEYFNGHWRGYTGLSEEESLDFGWSRALHPEDLGDFVKFLQMSVRSADVECEVRLRRESDGSYRRHLCRSSVLANRPEGLRRLLICCTDVEDWREAEKRARERGALLGLAMRSNDQEKRKIAHGLHDNAGQYLVALQMKLDGLQRCSIGNTGRKNPIVDECRELVRRCAKELRATSYLLYPPLLDDLGLESAVRLHVDGLMERAGAKIELNIEPSLGRLDRDLEIALFRVVQEALANICRLAAVKEAQVKVGASQTSVFVEVRGPGMELQPEKSSAGPNALGASGMAALRQRIREAGGAFEIDELAGSTAVRAEVPRKALVAHPCD